jgi:hypothetical protein
MESLRRSSGRCWWGGGVVVRCLLSAGTRCPTKVASYGLVAHFPSCSPVAVVVVVAHVFEQRLIA